jgi:flagellin-like hook-associated protein FlgL
LRNALLGGTAAQVAYANSVNVTSSPQAAGGFKLVVQDQLRTTETFALAGNAVTTAVANAGGAPALGGLGLAGAVVAATGTGGTFQVGAYAADTIAVSIAKVDAVGLGVSALDVVNAASTAMTALDSAISLVSGIRGTIGAVQNRFESTIANLQVSTENLTASESRIRDTDMALEMTNFTRSQIMQQAGTAMLAQANAVPQSILKLLQ